MFFVLVLTSAKSAWLQLGTLVLLDAEEEAVGGFFLLEEEMMAISLSVEKGMVFEVLVRLFKNLILQTLTDVMILSSTELLTSISSCMIGAKNPRLGHRGNYLHSLLILCST